MSTSNLLPETSLEIEELRIFLTKKVPLDTEKQKKNIILKPIHSSFC